MRRWIHRLSTAVTSVGLCAVAGAAAAPQGDAASAARPAPDPQDTQFTHEFGGDLDDPAVPGFRVRFDRRGAGVRAVRLLDHFEAAPGAPRDDEPYLLVREERVRPDDPSAGAYYWLVLEERKRGELFPDGLGVEAVWQVLERSDDVVRFTLDGASGLTIEKVFRYEPGARDLILEIALRAAEDLSLPELTLELGGLALVSPRAQYVFGANPARGVGVRSVDDGDPTVTFLAADGEPDADSPTLASGRPISFAGSTNRFFGGFLYPAPFRDDRETVESLRWVTMSEVPERPQHDTPAYTLPVPRYGIYLTVPKAGAETRVRYRYYLGPKSYRVFDEHPEYQRFDLVVDHDLDPPCCPMPGAQTIASLLLWLLGTLYDMVGSWGFAIVCLTIVVRSCVVPLNFRMQKSMRAYGAKMAKLKPKIEEVQKKYANDRQELQKHMMQMQREHKLFPPLGGCLPLLITLPVFLGLFSALRTSYDLRHQPFLAWINDLSQPDALFELGWGFLPYFNVLPIIMIAMWWWLQAQTPLPTDPQQRQVMKIMRFMPIMMGVLLYNYASGLMVYMITSSVFGLVESRVTRRILGPVSPDAAGVGATPMM